MTIYYVFTVDGDWEEYFNPKLAEEKRKPDKSKLLSWIDHEIRLASKLLNGRFIHFIHTSPRARDFFLQPEFISRWKEIERMGGSVGIHCHEDDPRRAYYYNVKEKMETGIGFLTKGLREKGLNPIAFRSGYLAFSPIIVPILEKNQIFLDFSCEAGWHLFHGNILVSDWRGAPENFYRLDYNDYRKPGRSQVFEIPLGIHLERHSLWEFCRKIIQYKKKKHDVVVSILTHSYEFVSFGKRLKIELALLILRIYGRFINAQEALAIIKDKIVKQK